MYKVVLKWALGHRKIVIGITVALLVWSIASVGLVGSEFIPSVDEGRISLDLEMASGTKLDDTAKVVRELEALVRKTLPEVKTISSTVGGCLLYTSFITLFE